MKIKCLFPSFAMLALFLGSSTGVLAQQAAPAVAPPPDIADFIRDDRFLQVRISPKGTYVAATVPLKADDKTVLVILKPGQKTPYGHVTLKARSTHVADFWWVNDERILFTVGERAGGLEAPVSMGEIWGTNADGTKQGIVAGVRADSNSPSSGKGRAQAVGIRMVDTLIEDDDNVLVSVSPPSDGHIPYSTLESMNVYTGTRRMLARAPVRGATFSVDHAGQVRFAEGLNRDYKSVLFYRKDDKSEWQEINDESKTYNKLSVMGFNADNVTAYLRAEEDTGPDSVRAFDSSTLQMKQIARDELVDPAGLVRAIGKRYPIGVLFMDGKPRFEYFDPSSADAKLHRSLQSSFGGAVAVATSSTIDGSHVLLEVFDDRNPGDLYIFDTVNRKATHFMSRADWMSKKSLAKMTPIYFKARDGQEIEGLLTLPAGSDGKNLPTIIHPHGGPFGVQDTWGYNQEVQMMAAHGYAVLQVNFRGSGGYGRSFLERGHKQWGLTMQDDLTDATRWAIAQNIADPNRICIYGASYGGYASLMGVAKEPDLYKCAVGYVGVYDLNMLWGRGDISQSSYGRDFLSEALGKDQLEQGSPSKQAAQIKAPVFLAAGGADVRAPQAHSEVMEKALKAAGKSVESLYYPTEGHGFVKEEHQIEYYSRLLRFFARYIGGREPVVPVVEKKKD